MRISRIAILGFIFFSVSYLDYFLIPRGALSQARIYEKKASIKTKLDIDQPIEDQIRGLNKQLIILDKMIQSRIQG